MRFQAINIDYLTVPPELIALSLEQKLQGTKIEIATVNQKLKENEAIGDAIAFKIKAKAEIEILDEYLDIKYRSIFNLAKEIKTEFGDETGERRHIYAICK